MFAFDSTPSSFPSAPPILGFSRNIDYGNSDFDRRHVGAVGFVFSPKAPKTGVLGQVLGGWSFSGVSHWQTGFPYTIANGVDRNGDGQSGPDRADISNINAPLNTRGLIHRRPLCATGYGNPGPDGTPVRGPRRRCTSSKVRALPNAFTVGRNTLRAPGIRQSGCSPSPSVSASRSAAGLEYRAEMFNALNTLSLGNFVAARTVNGSGSQAASWTSTKLTPTDAPCACD